MLALVDVVKFIAQNLSACWLGVPCNYGSRTLNALKHFSSRLLLLFPREWKGREKRKEKKRNVVASDKAFRGRWHTGDSDPESFPLQTEPIHPLLLPPREGISSFMHLT